MPDPDPAAIARRLSPAQRRALAWLPADGELARIAPKSLWPSLYALNERGLAEQVAYSDWWWITPFGLEVRAEVERTGRIARWMRRLRRLSRRALSASNAARWMGSRMIG